MSKLLVKAHLLGFYYESKFEESILRTIYREKTKHWIFRNVSFEVKSGKSMGIIGKNGQGKSTLLRLIAGIYTPDEGQLVNLASNSNYMDITGGLLKDLNARQNIYLILRLRGLSHHTARGLIDRILDYSEILVDKDLPVRHFSTGMKARLGFSIVSHIPSSLILIDEALAVGDKNFREKSKQKIREMKNGHTSQIIVSHNQSEILELCDECIVLDQGKVVFQGITSKAMTFYEQL